MKRAFWFDGAYMDQQIAEKYEAAGYRMPRLIFWNICGRTDQTQKDPYHFLN